MNGKLSALLLLSVIAFDSNPCRGQTSSSQPVRGPFWSGTIRGPRSNEAIAMKGIAITLGAKKNAYICYDTDLLRVSMAWTGQFLEFGNTLTKIEWPPPPQVIGTPLFGTKMGPGWAKDGSFEDPRLRHQGPLPKNWDHYQGLYQNGDRVVLQYTVNGVEVLETPDFEEVDGQPVFTRTIQLGQAVSDQKLQLADGVEGPNFAAELSAGAAPVSVPLGAGKSLFIVGMDLPAGSRLETTADGALVLKLGKVAAAQPFHIAFSTDGKATTFAGLRDKKPKDLRQFCQGGPAHWTETVVTQGTRGSGKEPYLVDTLTEPASNPYNVQTFFGGFDFFSDGRAAICTFHGDVWIVSGINESLEKLTWKRCAAGMFQPLGLKIVDDTVYVLGRDQITRLRDLNKDGEADFYENFNNDTIVTSNYHEFTLDLHTDRAGNFYFAKGSPWEPEVTSPHQGCLFKVSKDGSKIEIIATGLRAPNGMTVGPNDEITVSDNQGHWMPSSKINWIEKGGFYGMTPAAQRPVTLQRGGTNFVANPSDPEARQQFRFRAWGDASAPKPTGYDEPFCWLPQSMDNSSGGQVWVTGDKWGPMQNRLLFMSYGKCTLFEVMIDQVDGVRQGAMFQFPLKFGTGIMRGRVNPRDGQVYLCGLKGWQTSGTRIGGFYRVRYTGEPVHLPTAFHAAKTGVEIKFTCELDAKSAADSGNFSAERWNYLWTGAYGSPEFSVNNPSEKKHDKLDIKAARLGPDKKTVFLEIDDMKPAEQVKIKYSIDAADGASLSQEIYATVYKLGSAQEKLAVK